MFRKLANFGITITLAFVLAAMPVLAHSAQAASVVPPPVNILPSVVIGAKGALSTPEALALLLTRWVKSPEFAAAAAARRAGTATAAQAVMLADEAATFVAPATKAAPLMRAIGGAAVPLVGLQTGLMVGNGATRLFGFKDSMVCSQQNGVLTAISFVTNNVDCGAFNNALTTAQRNLDAAMSSTSPNSCLSNGQCYRIAGNAAFDATRYSPCILASGVGAATSNFIVQVSGVGPASVGGYNQYVCGAFGPGDKLQNAGLWNNGQVVTSLQALGTTSASDGPVVQVTNKPGNPDRQFKCTQYSLQGSVVVGLSEKFTENDPAFKNPACPSVPPGEVPSRTTIEEVGGPAAQPLLDAPTTPQYQNWRSTRPDCITGGCLTELFKGPVNCHSDAAACADWFTDPNKSSVYECRYGGAAVALAECNYLAPTFKPDAATTGQSYGDPETGASVGTSTSISADSGAFGSGVQDPAAPRQCFPTGWSAFNPVEWVVKPVQCALQWAFVPKPSVVSSKLSNIKSYFDTRTVGKAVTAVQGWAFVAPASGNCRGLAVNFAWLAPDLGTQYILPACPGDLFAPWAALSKTILYVGFSVVGVAGVTSNLARMFNYRGIGSEQ